MMTRAAGTIAAVTFSLLMAGPISAQNLSVGVKGGWNHADATLPLHSSVERVRANGFHAGAFVEMSISPALQVQVGALYSEKGLGGKGRDRDLQYELEAGFVQIPLMVKLRPAWEAAEGIAPYLIAGPTVGVEVNCRVRGKDGAAYLNHLCDGPPVNFDQRKRMDFGVTFGIGAEVPTRAGRLLAELAYEKGIRDLADSPDIPGEVRTGTLMLSVGFATGRGR